MNDTHFFLISETDKTHLKLKKLKTLMSETFYLFLFLRVHSLEKLKRVTL